MAVKVVWDGGVKFRGENENGAQVVMEPGQAFGGSGKYLTPMEVLAVALGGCTAMDILFILKKMRVDLKKLEVMIETQRKEEHPRYYEKIKMIYVASGDGLTEEKFKKAADLSNEKYCSVGVMLRDKAEITYEIKVD